MAKIADMDRKTRILDAAENAFADFGFEGASLRHIVLDAGVNLATVYYYFSSKEGLMSAVFSRRFAPLQAESLELLAQYRREFQGQLLPVEKILEAMVLPALHHTAAVSAQSSSVMRLIGRIVTEPNVQIQKLLQIQHGTVRVALLEALQQSLPDLPETDLLWRIEYFWGALAIVMCNANFIKEKTGGVCDPLDTKTMLSQMVTTFSAGFRAPAVIPKA
jgi:AcrR family transcriptional regulator